MALIDIDAIDKLSGWLRPKLPLGRHWYLIFTLPRRPRRRSPGKSRGGISSIRGPGSIANEIVYGSGPAVAARASQRFFIAFDNEWS